MSGSRIRLYGSTSGYVELEAPAVAPDASLVLPSTFAGIGSNLAQDVLTTAFTTTSTSSVDLLEVTFTPSSASSKVLLLCTGRIWNDTNGWTALNFVRDGTDIGQSTGGTSNATMIARPNQPDSMSGSDGFAMSFLDSPGTTSAITYKVQVKVSGGTGYIGRSEVTANTPSITTFTAIEVAA